MTKLEKFNEAHIIFETIADVEKNTYGQLARFLRNNVDDINTLKVKTLQDLSFCSISTPTTLDQKCGLAGFNELKIMLQIFNETEKKIKEN